MSALDSVHVKTIVFNMTLSWISNLTRFTVDQIDIDKQFSAAFPDGYGVTQGAYYNFCDDAGNTLTTIAGRSIALPINWRQAHIGDSLSKLITQITLVVLSSPPTAIGAASMRWVLDAAVDISPAAGWETPLKPDRRKIKKARTPGGRSVTKSRKAKKD